MGCNPAGWRQHQLTRVHTVKWRVMLTLLSWTLGSMEEEAKQIRKLWQSHCFTFRLLTQTIREDNKRRYISTGSSSLVSHGELVRWSEQPSYADILTKCSTEVRRPRCDQVNLCWNQAPSSVKWRSWDFSGKGEHFEHTSLILCFSCITSSLRSHTQHRAAQGRAGKYSCCTFLLYNISRYQN